MSLVSEQGVFSVGGKSQAPKPAKAAPITTMDTDEATAGHIRINWPDIVDASDYKVYWDRGVNNGMFHILTATTKG